jgi:hypothetical protein
MEGKVLIIIAIIVVLLIIYVFQYYSSINYKTITYSLMTLDGDLVDSKDKVLLKDNYSINFGFKTIQSGILLKIGDAEINIICLISDLGKLEFINKNGEFMNRIPSNVSLMDGIWHDIVLEKVSSTELSLLVDKDPPIILTLSESNIAKIIPYSQIFIGPMYGCIGHISIHCDGETKKYLDFIVPVDSKVVGKCG